VVCWCWGGHVGLFTNTVIYISDTEGGLSRYIAQHCINQRVRA